MFDKNNWYIEEDSLTQEQFVNVCKYLVENYPNKEGCDQVMRASEGAWDGASFVGFFDAMGAVKGKYFVDYLPSAYFNYYCDQINYKEFERYLLNDSVQDDDGWINWEGGECPVKEGTLVDVVYRNGEVNYHVKAGLPREYADASLENASAVKWTCLGLSWDIIKYRLHKASDASSESPDANTSPDPEKPSESISERLVTIQKELLEVIGEIGCNITIYNDEITVNLGECYGDKEFTWRDDLHSVEDLQKLLEGVKLIKQFDDKC